MNLRRAGVRGVFCEVDPKNIYRDPGRGKVGPYRLRGTVVTECEGNRKDDLEKITIGVYFEKYYKDSRGFAPAPYGSFYYEVYSPEETVLRPVSNFCRSGLWRIHIYMTIYADTIPGGELPQAEGTSREVKEIKC